MPQTLRNPQIAEEAADWAVLIDAGSLETDERKALADWLLESPRHIEELLFTVSILSGLKFVDPDGKIQIESILEDSAPEIIPLLRNGNGAGNDNESLHQKSISGGRQRFHVFAWALICLFLAGTLWLQYPAASGSGETPEAPTKVASNAQEDDEIYTTQRGEQRTIALADGSLVHVNTQSEIAVRFQKTRRIVELVSGEALFEVAHDPDRPFRVVSGGTIAEAIGTKFNVHKTAAGVDVVVVEGKVAIGSGKAPEKSELVNAGNSIEATATKSLPDLKRLDDGRLLLRAGEQVRVQSNASPAFVSRANIAAITSWRTRQLTFEADDLQSIANEFNRYNKVQITISDPGLAQTEFSGIFGADDPESLIAFLEYTGDVVVDKSQPDKIELRAAADR